ncbi:hypothetical protein FIBSPDRAFT_66396 [Athelia psychrophila]|uniref:Secreted protein n=1 Tax=Athelia psychrophila TaxID=1759441 RepID=A0A166ET42_9AGAM|nr:hypothetical protein FIBSPDRAFT_66396 [Fibularhizoctonia sp. CBS 109695]
MTDHRSVIMMLDLLLSAALKSSQVWSRDHRTIPEGHSHRPVSLRCGQLQHISKLGRASRNWSPAAYPWPPCHWPAMNFVLRHTHSQGPMASHNYHIETPWKMFAKTTRVSATRNGGYQMLDTIKWNSIGGQRLVNLERPGCSASGSYTVPGTQTWCFIAEQARKFLQHAPAWNTRGKKWHRPHQCARGERPIGVLSSHLPACEQWPIFSISSFERTFIL